MAALGGSRARRRDTDLRVLALAAGASVLLHIAFVLGFPQWVAKEHMVILPGPLRARLAPPAPASVVPARDEPRAPQPAAKPSPARSAAVPAGPGEARAPAPAAAPWAMEPLAPAPAAPVSNPAQSEPPAAVLAVEPKPRSAGPGQGVPPAEGAAAREAVAAAQPAASADEPATVGQYRIALIEAARGFRSYPRLARENNWQGRVTVRVAFAPGGVVAALAVSSGSGYPVLDQQALAMISRATAQTPVPPQLRAREFSVEIPVIFDLKDE